MQTLESRILAAWAGTPAKVVVKEIQARGELLRWQDCGKDELFIGVVRGKNDSVFVVRHQMEAQFRVRGKAETLSDKTLHELGFFPRGSQTCADCGEFSTRINVGGLCTDCLDKQRVKRGDNLASAKAQAKAAP